MFVIWIGIHRTERCGRESFRRRHDEVLLEVACPVCRESARTTPLAQLQRPFEVAKFDAEPRECRKRVDDEPTAIAGVVVTLIGIQPRLGSAVDTDRVGNSLVLAPRMCLASLGAGRSVAECTPRERLLHHSASASALRPTVQPRWKTASCVAKSNAVPLGS